MAIATFVCMLIAHLIPESPRRHPIAIIVTHPVSQIILAATFVFSALDTLYRRHTISKITDLDDLRHELFRVSKIPAGMQIADVEAVIQVALPVSLVAAVGLGTLGEFQAAGGFGVVAAAIWARSRIESRGAEVRARVRRLALYWEHELEEHIRVYTWGDSASSREDKAKPEDQAPR